MKWSPSLSTILRCCSRGQPAADGNRRLLVMMKSSTLGMEKQEATTPNEHAKLAAGQLDLYGRKERHRYLSRAFQPLA